MKALRYSAACLYVLCAPCVLTAQTLTGSGVQVDVSSAGAGLHEVLAVKVGEQWKPALDGSNAVHVLLGDRMVVCRATAATVVAQEMLLKGECPDAGTFEQHVRLTPEPDVLDVTTRVFLQPGVEVRSVEDRYNFLQPRNATVDEHTGPLDFVWSQNIKSQADDLIPGNDFKSPAVMMQQGGVFTAIVPTLNNWHAEPVALDLDVTSEAQPWMSYGFIPAVPHGHSYFRRASTTLSPLVSTVVLHGTGGSIEYRYSLVLSAQPPKQGYRRVTRLLWHWMGHKALLRSPDLQQNVLQPWLHSFASWREQAWHTEADRVYQSFPCGDRTCGSLKTARNVKGIWGHGEPDAWFNAWFETLRTAYGWYAHGREVHDTAMMAKAESVLNLALSAPQKNGAFPTIYLINSHEWIPGDGWAGYDDSYPTFSMSWTAYWLLRWAEDLTPERKPEILRYVRAYGDFLLANQRSSGVMPSWFFATTLKPREELRDLNAETAPSALLLATLGTATGEARYTEGAERAMKFVEEQVVPRQRWFDFETFLSCARKGYGFFDSWTAQYPQNNLAEIQAPQAMLTLWLATHKPEYLESGKRMLDYLLLSQQVWSNPIFTPNLVGGFTTQNTDSEWSDARQGYVATLLFDYYRATGDMEYLERAVAAARSTFAVAPWENWAHTGYMDDPGALTGFHWGTGSAMTSVELMSSLLSDALVDVRAGRAVGFDECSVDNVVLSGDTISFHIWSADVDRSFRVRFTGVNAKQKYLVRVNAEPAVPVLGQVLMDEGFEARLSR